MKVANFFRKFSLLEKLRPNLPSFSGTSSQQQPIRVQSIVKNGEFERALINSSLSKNEMRHLFRLMEFNCSKLSYILSNETLALSPFRFAANSKVFDLCEKV